MNRELLVMADKQRAARLKKAILSAGTYEEVSDKTGISVRTLVRLASGQTEPKFSDVLRLSEVTGVDLYKLAYDDPEQVQRDASDRELLTTVDGYSDSDVTNAHHFIIWNLRHLEKQDILALERQVSALSSYSYANRMSRSRLDVGSQLSLAVRRKQHATYEEILQEQKDKYGKTAEEIEELRKKYPLEGGK